MKKQGFAKVRDFMKGKGFVVALMLSVAAVGFSTYYAYNSIMNSFEEGTGSENLFVDVDKNQGGIPKDTAAPITNPQETVSPSETTAETEPAATAANNFFSSKSPRALPIEGEIINPYSDGELVKSETLNLWQTHDGIDIEDGLWGVCISIDHGDGYVSSYCGVDKSVPVTIGQEVACGDVIAKAGNTAECECALPSHLHFEVKKDGEFVSPLSFTENN